MTRTAGNGSTIMNGCRLVRAAAMFVGLAATVACSGPIGHGAGSPPAAAASRGAGATAADDAAVAAELMRVDREYARDTAEGGIDGWVGALSADAARVDLHGPIARGPEGARRQDAALFADPAVRLAWEPVDAGVFEGRRLGFTRGRYRVLRSDPSGGEARVTAAGAYLTIWRRDGVGWRVILDTGAPDPPGEPAAP